MDTPLTPQQATNNFKLLLDIVRSGVSPNQLVAELEHQLTARIAQGVQGDDNHPALMPTNQTPNPTNPMKLSALLTAAAATWPDFHLFPLIQLPPLDGDSFAITLFTFTAKPDSPFPETPKLAVTHGNGEWEKIQSLAEGMKSRHQDVRWDTYTTDITREKLAHCPHESAAGAIRWRTDLPKQPPHFSRVRL